MQKRVLRKQTGLINDIGLKAGCSRSTQSQVFNLNIVPDKTNPTQIRSIEEPQATEDVPVIYDDQASQVEADEILNELKQQISDRDKMCQALSLIIEILENNPIIINKWVVADDQTLKQLILLLTDADEVDIQIGDIDCGCSQTKYSNIQCIYVIKDGTAQNFKYSCPNACRILDTHRISTNLVW